MDPIRGAHALLAALTLGAVASDVPTASPSQTANALRPPPAIFVARTPVPPSARRARSYLAAADTSADSGRNAPVRYTTLSPDAAAGTAAEAALVEAAAPAPEPVVIELRIGRITSATVQAYRVRSEVLIPLSQFFQLVEIRHRLTPDGRLEATVDPGNRRIVIDPASDSMEFGDRRVHIEPEFIRFESPELYVGSERLGDLLGVMFAVDWSELTATVVDPSSLPIARRLTREGAREAYLRRPDALHADVMMGLERPSWDGVVADYSLFSPSADPLGGSTYTFGLGADVGGGSLEMLAQSVGPAQDGRIHLDASWTGVWRQSLGE